MESLVGMDVLRRVYQGKKVFLTGHTGFKGAWLLKILSMLGAEVKGYSLAPVHGHNLYNSLNGDSLCSSVINDIRDSEVLKAELLNFQPDYVFHLAAQPLVRLSYKQPVETFTVNAIGTANVLDSVRYLEKPCSVVLITTDKVYHNNEWLYPYRENDRLGGYDPYSASKACAELIVDSYRNSFFNIEEYSKHLKGIAVARAGNVIGGGDWAEDRIIPDIVRALSSGSVVPVRNPQAVRPWQHVLEPLNGYLLLGMKLAEVPNRYSDAYNFGPYIDDTLTVKELVTKAIDIWGSGDYLISEQSNPVHEAGLLKLDISKATTELCWKPKMNADKALYSTINWFKQEREGIVATALCEAQIEEYFNSLV